MANVNAPFGLKPVRTLGGVPYNASFANRYYAASGYGTALYIGDLVTLAGTATANATAIANSSAGGGIGTLQNIERCAAGGTKEVIGVVVGFEPLRTDLTKQYNPASTERVVYVCDCPEMIFRIQGDGYLADTDSAATHTALAGLNADIIATAGSTYTGISAMSLDEGTSTTPATTAALPLRILQVANIPNNAGDQKYKIWEVMINEHMLKQGSAGVTGAN